MNDILQRLSSRSVLERKRAIKELRRSLGSKNDYMARLFLHYVSEHDPAFTVRNIARQAFYRVSKPPGEGNWEKHFLFHRE